MLISEKIKKYYHDNNLIINCSILAILFFINCFIQDFSLLIFMLLMVYVIFANMQDAFVTIVFCIPFCAIDLYVGLFMYFMTVIVFLIKSYYRYFFVDKKRPDLYLLISTIVFAIYAILPIGNYNGSIFIKLGIILVILMVFNLFITYKDEMNLRNALNIVAFSALISAIFSLTYFISPYMASKELWPMGDYIRYTALLSNPNELAMLCEICLSFLCYFILSKKCTWIEIISFVIFAVMGLSTFSKTFLILLTLMLIIVFIYSLKKYKKIMLWVALGLLVVGVVFFIIQKDFIISYLQRFIDVDIQNLTFKEFMNILTTNRYDLWLGVLSYIFMNPLVLIFGRGFGAPLVCDMSAHNFYISLLYELGIVGSLLFLTMFAMLLRVYIKQNNNKFNFALLVPMIIIGLLLMVEDLFLYIY